MSAATASSSALALSPHNRMITFKKLREISLPYPGKPIKIKLISQESKYAISTTKGSIEVRDSTTHESLLHIHANCDSINDFAQIKTGQLFGACKYGVLKIWNIENGKCEEVLDDCMISPASNLLDLPNDDLIIGSFGPSIQHWSKKNMPLTGYYCKRNFKSEKQVYCLAMVLIDDEVVACGSDNDVNIYSIPKRVIIKQLRGHTRTITCLCNEASRKWLISGSEDGTVKIWNWHKENALLRTLRGHTRKVVKVIAISEKWLLSAGMDSKIRICSIGSGRCEGDVDPKMTVVDMVRKTDGPIILCGEESKISVWRIDIQDKTCFL